MERSRKIIQASIVGIAVNVILVLFKMAVGLVTGSIAVILDAVNNLSDALSSVITIIGTKLAGRAPDKKHPYGYGRIEYLTSALIAIVVLVAGITSLKESVEKIISPTVSEYSVASLVIIGAAIAVKFLTGRYVKKVGETVNSGSLIASGADAFFDSILTMTTLAAAIISMLWEISLEGFFGVVISGFIIKAGIEILAETLNSIVGIRVDKDLTEKLKSKVCSYEEVRGVYDLRLHNYGPAQIIGSLHIEVDDNMTAKELHKLTRRIIVDVYGEFGIILTIGIYASNTSTAESEEIKKALYKIAGNRTEILQIHGFYMDTEQAGVSFDLIVDFDADAAAVRDQVLAEISRLYPQYRFFAILDSDYSD